jgi:two-component system response regulator AtoC
MENILVVEDSDSLREVLAAVLASEGHRVTAAVSGEDAMARLKSEEFSLILSDLKLPGIDGLEFVKQSKSLGTKAPMIVMTAYGSIDIAVQAMKLGAMDFITKPFDPSALCNMISQLSAHRRIVDRNFSAVKKQYRRIISQSPQMQELLHQCKKVAAYNPTVMILGESGTGKELIARYIHDASPRVNNDFVAINCASMPSALLESEFFGHEAGSFTGATEQRIGLFEVADKGTIFLDEIGNMAAQLQIKLLRVLQESEIKRIGSNKVKKIDTRVISATNANIEEALKNGLLREDLYYRLGVIILEIPPLRERTGDVELLAQYFVKRFCAEKLDGQLTLSKAAIKKLNDYDWPGNVRELENLIERAVVFCKGARIEADDIVIAPESDVDNGDMPNTQQTLASISHSAQRIAEMTAIKDVLKEAKGNKSKAARMLGVSYKTLLNKVKEYEL